MEEIWKPVVGYEGRYDISSMGRVKSLQRRFVLSDRVIKPFIDKCGYVGVGIRRNGKSFHKNIHRLIALAFIPNPKNKKEVNHIDANKCNNSISNLEWVTPQENVDHAVRLKLYRVEKGELHNRAKLKNKDVIYIRQSKRTDRDLAKEFKVSFALISLIKNRKCWKHI